MPKCMELNATCRNCGRSFRRDERYEKCPDCGEDRHCTQYAKTGSVYCQEHDAYSVERGFGGVRQGRGIVTGRQSKSMIARMASKYLEQTKDPRYMLGKKSIDLIDARILDLMDRIDTESSPDRINRLAKRWQALKEQVPGLRSFLGKNDKATLAYDLFEQELEAAFTDYQAWRQIFEALELRRKHTESEVKILKELKAMMTAEDGMELVAQLFAAIIEVLRDEPKGQDYITLIRIKFEALVGATVDPEVQTRRGEVIDL